MLTNDALSALQANSSASARGSATGSHGVLAPVTRDPTYEALVDFDPPQIPAAQAYDGIGARDVNKPDGKIKVIVPPSILWDLGDSIALYWGDDRVAVAHHVLGAGDLGLPLTLEVDVLIVQRVYDASGLQVSPVDVWYVFTTGNTGDEQSSVATTIIVKLTLPGGPDPDPIGTPWTNDNLAPAEIPDGIIGGPDADNGVPVTVLPWLNMAEGDVLRIRWGTQSVFHAPLTASEVGLPVTVMIGKATIIDAGDSDTLMVTYDIDDIVREWSLNSLPVFAKVEAGDAILSPPTVLEAQAGDLDYDALGGDDATIVIAFQDPPMVVGGTLHIVFDGLASDGHTLRHEFDVAIVSQAPVIGADLPNDVIGEVTPGTASLYYIVRDGTGDTGRSQRTSLRILGERVALPAPVVPEAVGDELDPADATAGATVVVAAWAGMAVGDVLTLRWEGTKASGLPMVHTEDKTVAAVGASVSFLVPPDYVAGLAGGAVDVFYIVKPADGDASTRESDHLALRVTGESALPAPQVVGMVGGELNPPDDPVATVDVIIPVWELMSVGDVLEAFWDGQSPEGSTSGEVTMTAADLAKPYVFTVPRRVIDVNAAGQGAVDAWYRVTRAGQSTPQTSAITRFRVVAPSLDLLPPPKVDEAVGNILDPAPLPAAGATIRVAPYAGMIAGDYLTLRFGPGTGGGEHIDVIDVTENMVGRDMTLRVPKTKVQFHLSSTVIVNYTVHRLDGSEQDSENLVLSVRSETKWPAPDVDEAEGDYLDPELAEFGVATRVFGYTDMQRNDRIVLHWGNPGDTGYYTDSITVSTERDYQFRLLPEDVTPWIGRTVPIWYEVERGTQHFTSETFSLRVGMAQQELLDAPDVVEAGGGILDPSDLITSATARIPVYDGMRSGDYIHMTWGGGPGSGGLEWFIDVTQGMVGNPITRPIPLANITPFDGKDVTLVYTVDSGTPPERQSEEYTVRVQRGTMDLPAPEVPALRDDGVLDPRDVAQGAEVRVLHVDGMQQGDTIRLHWDSTIDGGSDEQDKIVGSTADPITFTVATDKVLAGVDGGVAAWYELVRGGSVIGTSDKLDFTIKLSALPLPVIDQADGDTLDPDDVPAGGATVTLAAAAFFKQGDRIALSWDGAPGNGTGQYSHTVTAGEAGNSVKIAVPKAIVEANNGGTVALSYSVTRAAGGPVETSGRKIYDVRREIGSGDLLVMGARYNGSVYRASSAAQYLRALNRTSRADLVAEWRYDDEVTWTTGVTFKDTRPWRSLLVRSATNQVTINAANIIGTGGDSVTVQGNAALVAYLTRKNVIGWGNAAYGANVPPTIITYTDVVEVSSTRSAYALRRVNGQVAVWGNTAEGGAIPGGGADIVNAVRIHSNGTAFAAVRGSGYLSAWGTAAAGGQLTAEAQGLTDVAFVAATGTAFCALRRNGQLVGWGTTASGGTVPPEIKALTDIHDVRGNFTAFCALRATGAVVAWGVPADGGAVPQAIAVRTDIIELASASSRALAVRTGNGQVLTWGQAGYGGAVPAEIGALNDIEEVTATWGAFCARRGNGAVVAWGDATRGGAVPTDIAVLTDIVQVAGSSGAFAALRRNGTVVTWGLAAVGGNSSAVAGLLVNIRAVYANTDAFVAIEDVGGAVTWGVPTGGGNSDAVRPILDTNLFYQALAGGASKHARATQKGRPVAAAPVPVK
ncbi:hypothetical protein PIN31009_04349 [Pandoraea iniqua]|uniref:hypothetical protein n=1 Tax=Pandoraea iniqua TaxID=2508288 RepID=UPI00123FFDEE|nr:hypothetical protein [Pandoraea iniqua]VVE45564.1 hypothetical protein PIN31009_04349 [Pandoraea iniqua]